MLSISGIFSVTFSIVFAFVADITSEDERVAGYGLVRLFLWWWWVLLSFSLSFYCAAVCMTG